ncbi:hypothetical protein [Burkholderia sp. Bp8990]|uniref:hypothetical protein n=1 Tax=Burkholderia sp. Bp8990 TaxID=2184552 RepID=UPI000F59812E
MQKQIRNGGAFITPNGFIGESLFRLLPAPEAVMRGAGRGAARIPACGGHSRLSSIQKICSLASNNLNQWMLKMP